MACDMTIAAEGAFFGEPEPKFGSGIVALLLPWLTGPKQAKEMLLFGNDRVSAQKAYEMGLINTVVKPEALLDELTAAAGRCAMLDAEAVRLTKTAINDSYSRMGPEDALRQALDIDAVTESTETEESRTSKDILAKDGVKAAVARNAVLRGLGFLNRPDQMVRCVAFVVDCEVYVRRQQGLCGTQRHSIRPGTHFSNDRRWLGGRGYSCSVAAFSSRATAASYCAWSRWPMPDFRGIVFRPTRRPFESDFG
jgi:hypothetical protein